MKFEFDAALFPLYAIMVKIEDVQPQGMEA